jgi:phage gp46-like protein
MANNNKDLALRADGYNALVSRYGFSRDPATGDVYFDTTQAYGVMNSGICRKNGYWADPNHGSELWTLRNQSSRTPSQAEAMLLEAEQPLVDAHLIEQPTIAARGQDSRLFTDLDWNTPAGAKGAGTIEV